MGIQNDVILCYGIEFSYDDIIHLQDTIEFKKLAEDIGANNMSNLWGEMGHIVCSNYYDQPDEYYNYIIGKELGSNITLHEFLNEINENEIKISLQKICKEYDLQYREPVILCRSNVY